MSHERPGTGEPPGEFDEIARLFRPLTFGAPEALELLDDAAVIPARPGFDLVVTKDAMVEGVHFLPDDPPDLVARKLLRVNLSDLAAKGAEPYGYFLATAWPASWGPDRRAAFAEGLKADQTRFGLVLLGGDTVSTPGPLTVSATLLGWVPAGRMVKRSGARPGDVLMTSGAIGDGGLGLLATEGTLSGLAAEHGQTLIGRYRLPEPRLALGEALRSLAHAAADVSDGLLADAGHIAEASGCGVEVELEAMPLSEAGRAWLKGQGDGASARLRLAAAGDDYEIICAAPAEAERELGEAARAMGLELTRVGRFTAQAGLRVLHKGQPVRAERTGWTHL